MQHHDVIVIGAGPAGTAAAVRAAELGADVAVVEAGRPGGVCTNTGCTPVRVLARTARLVRDAQSAATYGVGLDAPTVDWSATMQQVRTVVERVHDVKRERERFAETGVQLVHGRARFTDPHTVELVGTPDRLSADQLVLAVGGHSRRLPFPGADLAVLGEQVLDLPALPARVAIVGSGSTGVQLATIFAAFGSEVVILDLATG
jgi:glutathione reductase (NADPH)